MAHFPYLFMTVLLAAADACSVMFDHFTPLNEFQRMARFDIMVYGEYLNTTKIDMDNFRTEGLFRVDCVLRNDDSNETIPDVITIKDPQSPLSCDDTRIEPGGVYIAGLTRKNNEFRFHNFPLQSSALQANEINLKMAVSLCNVHNVTMASAAIRASDACSLMEDYQAKMKANGVCIDIVLKSDDLGTVEKSRSLFEEKLMGKLSDDKDLP